MTFSRKDGSLEDFGHLSEFKLNYVYKSDVAKKSSLDGTDLSKLNDWEKFVLCKPNATASTKIYGVGMMHFSPNSTSDYDWSNTTPVNTYWKDYVDGDINNIGTTESDISTFTYKVYDTTEYAGIGKDSSSDSLSAVITPVASGSAIITAKIGNSSVQCKVTVSAPLRPTQKAMTVTWNTNSKASGYEIRYSTSDKFTSYKTISISSKSTKSKKITGLTKSKTYYVTIRNKKNVGGKTYYGPWSSALKVKIKK